MMNIQFNFFDNLQWLREEPQVYLAHYSHYLVTNLRRLTPYLKDNLYTEAISILAVNGALIYLSDKVMDIVARRWQVNDNSTLWMKGGKWCCKAILLYGGSCAFNQLMNMQLSRFYLVSSVIAALAMQRVWQKFFQPTLSDAKRMTEENSVQVPDKASSPLDDPKQPPVEEEIEKADVIQDPEEETSPLQPPKKEPEGEQKRGGITEVQADGKPATPNSALDSILLTDRLKKYQNMGRKKERESRL